MAAVIGSLRAELSASIAKFQDDMGKAADSVKSLSRTFSGVATDLKRTGTQVTAIGTALTKAITVPVAGVIGATAKIGISFESAFAGVKKTVDGVVDDLGRLTPVGQQIQQGFRDLAKEIPVSVNELAKLGETAGALGIPRDQIVEFAKVMAELGVTTNLTSDDAANAIARIQNIFGAAGKDTDRFASTLVALGNAGASTESEIVAMAQRIAGAGHVVGLTQGQVLAFGSALSSVGIEAEAGGSAISKVFIELAQAVTNGGAKLQGFAQVAGQSGAAFAQAFKTDAAGATTSFIEGLGRIQKSGGDVFGTLQDLGLTEVRLRDALLRAAGAGDLLRDSLALQADAWQKNSALTKEAEQRFKTTESQLTLLWNRIKDVGITLFTALKPAIDAALEAMNTMVPVIEGMVTAFGHLPKGTQLAVIGIGAVAAAAGPVLFIAGQLISSLGTLVGAFGKAGLATQGILAALSLGQKVFGALTSVVLETSGATAGLAFEWGKSTILIGGAGSKLAGIFAGLSGVVETVGAAFAALINPITLTIGVITAVGIAIAVLTGHWDDLKKGAALAWQALKDIATILGSIAAGVLTEIVGYVKTFISALEDLASAIVGPVVQAFQTFVAWLKDHIPTWVITLIDKFKDFLGWTKKVSTEGAGWLHDYAEAVRSMADDVAKNIDKAAKALPNLLPDTVAVGYKNIRDAALALDAQMRASAAGTKIARSGFDDLAEGLKAARAELAKLSPADTAKLTQAIQSGAFSMEDLAKKTHLSETAIKLFQKQVEETSKSQSLLTNFTNKVKDLVTGLREAAKFNAPVDFVKEQWGPAIQDAIQLAVVFHKTVPKEIGAAFLEIAKSDNAKFLRSEMEKAFEGIGATLTKQIEQGRASFTKNLDAIVKAQRSASDIRNKLALNDYDYQVMLIQREAQDKKDALDETGANYQEALQAIDDETDAKMADAARAWKDHLAEMNAATNSWGNLTRKWIGQIPDLLQKAFTGGGGFGGAIKALFSGIGGDIGGKLFEAGGALNKIGGKISQGFGKIFGDGIGNAIGLALPGIGQAIGSLIGPLITKIGRLIKGAPEWEKFAKDVGRDLGVTISDALAKQLEGDSKKFGRQAAELLNLDKIIGEAGGVKSFGFDKATKAAHDLFSQIDLGKLSVSQVSKEFDTLFGQLAEQVGPGGLVSKGFVELIKLNDRFGTQAASVAKFIGDQVSTNIVGGLTAFTSASDKATTGLKDNQAKLADLQKQLSQSTSAEDQSRLKKEIEGVSDEISKQTGLLDALKITSQGAADALAGSVAVAFSEMQKAGVPILDIVAKLDPVVATLQQQFATAGLTGGAVFDALAAKVALAKDAIAGPAIQAVTGLGQTLAGLSNIGQLDQSTFSGLTSQITSTFNSLTAQGKDGATVLGLMQTPLQTVWELSQKFGFAVDEGTQALLDQAEAAGIVGEKQKPINEQMLDATNRIADAVEGIASAFGVLPKSAKDAADGINTNLNKIHPPTITIPYQFDGPDSIAFPGTEVPIPASFAEGTQGIKDFGTGTLAILHGKEAVFTEDQLSQMTTAGAPAPTSVGGVAAVGSATGGDTSAFGSVSDSASKALVTVASLVDQMKTAVPEAASAGAAEIKKTLDLVSALWTNQSTPIQESTANTQTALSSVAGDLTHTFTQVTGDSKEAIDQAYHDLVQQMEEARKAAEQTASGMTEELKKIDPPTITVPVEFKLGQSDLSKLFYHPESSGALSSGTPLDQLFTTSNSFAEGTQGIKDFGAGTLAILHGKEAVFTAEQLDQMTAAGAPQGVTSTGALTQSAEQAKALINKVATAMQTALPDDAAEDALRAIDVAWSAMQQQMAGLPSDAEKAAAGINEAFNKIKPPQLTFDRATLPTPSTDTSEDRGEATHPVGSSTTTPKIFRPPSSFEFHTTNSFRDGTGGLQDFGMGELAILHGREAVVTESEYKDLIRPTVVASGSTPDMRELIAAVRELAASVVAVADRDVVVEMDSVEVAKASARGTIRGSDAWRTWNSIVSQMG